MPVKPFVADLGELPEALRPHYLPADGGYRLDLEAAAPAAVDPAGAVPAAAPASPPSAAAPLPGGDPPSSTPRPSAALVARLEDSLIETAAAQAIQAARGHEALLLPLLRPRLRLVERGSGLAVEVQGEDGRGQPLPALLEAMRTDARYAPAFAPVRPAGSGALGAAPAAAVPAISIRDQAALNANVAAIAAGRLRVTD
ncbi:MAG: hypothetical protein OHK0024_21260 [Thalassobaculales bacterium]